ncbi:MAG TPA: alpha/beta fold hydrolase [Isosphaeraceae bacterium]|jgi:pimeloyl-ACP methyl ester carboxylesterase
MPGIARLIVVMGLAFAPGASGPARVRVPLSEAGEVDVGEVIARVAERAGVAIERPPGALPLPMTGLAGTLTRTLLARALGPDVDLTVGPRELVITLPADRPGPEADADLAARLDGLAARAQEEVRRLARYGLRARGSYRPDDPSRPTVCLIHGLNSTSGVFAHVIPRLEAAGFGVVIYDYPFNRHLDRTAGAFRRDWSEFRLRMKDARPWAIVAHSMGGLLARSYVEGDDYAGDVSTLILIGPPNGGSAIARAQTLFQLIQGVRTARGRGGLAGLADGLGEAADDLMPGSAFLESLNARPRRAGVPYHILAGDAGILTPALRRQVESQYRSLFDRAGDLFGGLARLALGDFREQLDAVTDGTGDGCVAVAATRLAGVSDHRTIHANHVELVRGPLLYPDPGPIACMPFVLEWLGAGTGDSPRRHGDAQTGKIVEVRGDPGRPS